MFREQSNMSFDTEKYRIRNLNEEAIENSIQLQRLEKSNLVILDKIAIMQKTQRSMSTEIDYSSDWVELETRESDIDPETGEYTDEESDWESQLKGLEIEIGIFDVRLLPYITVMFVLAPVEEVDQGKIISWNYKGYFFQVDDIPGAVNENFKNVTLKLGMRITDFRPHGHGGDYELKRPWKMKAIVKFFNPVQYS